MRIVNRLFILGLFLGMVGQTKATDLPKEKKDTISRKVVFHTLISARPVVNWLQSIDTAGYFFNSPTQFEVQASYKKHSLGLGFNYEKV